MVRLWAKLRILWTKPFPYHSPWYHNRVPLGHEKPFSIPGNSLKTQLKDCTRFPGSNIQFSFKTSHHAIPQNWGSENTENSMVGTRPCFTRAPLGFLFEGQLMCVSQTRLTKWWQRWNSSFLIQRKHSPNLCKWAQEAPGQVRISFVAGSCARNYDARERSICIPRRKKGS